MTRGNTAMIVVTLCVVAAGGISVSCDNSRGRLPKSGGAPYEVLVVGDKDNLVKKALSVDMECLPQREPEFDVSTVSADGWGATLKLARNIVIVDINPKSYDKTKIKLAHNVYAQPQIVACVQSPSVDSLRRHLPAYASTLIKTLGKAETKATIERLSKHRNAQAEKMLKEWLGVDMWIPQDMVSSKRGKNFVWLSNNSPTGMQNIMIYKHDAPRGIKDFVAMRDSVAHVNIKGETDNMSMATVAATVAAYKTKQNGHDVIVFRGLWEMKGDDMGGPFVSHSVGNVTAEAFVFAPGKKKRNLLRQIEAALYTLK